MRRRISFGYGHDWKESSSHHQAFILIRLHTDIHFKICYLVSMKSRMSYVHFVLTNILCIFRKAKAISDIGFVGYRKVGGSIV